MLPEFIFAGPTKTGTTWIDRYLRARGDIGLPLKVKETFYFDRKFDLPIDWYERHFADQDDRRRRVEVAPSLFHKREAAERLARAIPGVQVVFTIRDPVDRAVSHYFHYLKIGEPDVDFPTMSSAHPDIVDAGRYCQHLTMWRELLGPDRLHYLYYDELVGDPFAFCRRLCDILQVPYMPPGPDQVGHHANAGSLPRYPAIARLARFATRHLRRAGLHDVVNGIKRTGIKRRVFGGGRSDIGERRRIAAGQAQPLRETLLGELHDLEVLLGRDLSPWRRRA